MEERLVNTSTTYDSENISIVLNSTVLNVSDDHITSDGQIGRMLTITVYPVIIIVGTFGNLVTFIVMQKGSLKHSLTCFYMAILALSDTSK